MTATALPRVPRPRPTLRIPGTPGSWLLALVTIGAVTFGSLLVVVGTPFVRVPLAMGVGFALAMVVLARPAVGVMATFAYLVFMAFLRRLLIPTTGWWQTDPFLLVAPFLVGLLIVKLFVLERRRLAPDVLSKLVLVLVAVSIVEVANPAGGGPGVGIVGMLYVTVPLLWFFVGRELLGETAAARLLGLLVLLGVVVAAYGLMQVEIGHPSWDREWVNVAGYDALKIGHTVRPFGTFSSSAEYALFLGTALVVAVALALRGRAVVLLALPVLGVALFLASARAALVTAAFAIVVVIGLRTMRPMRALAVLLVAAAALFGAYKVFGSSLTADARGSGNALITHQLGGLTDPLDPNSSTLLVHLALVLEGAKWSLHHPVGQGTASTNVGGVARAPGEGEHGARTSGSTEVDLSNSFVAFGPGGGVLYLVIVLLVLFQAVRCLFAGRWTMLPVAGLLIVGLGQWLTGGHYALAPLTWLLIGTVAATAAHTPGRRHRSAAA
jgi:hypothetical protein